MITCLLGSSDPTHSASSLLAETIPRPREPACCLDELLPPYERAVGQPISLHLLQNASDLLSVPSACVVQLCCSWPVPVAARQRPVGAVPRLWHGAHLAQGGDSQVLALPHRPPAQLSGRLRSGAQRGPLVLPLLRPPGAPPGVPRRLALPNTWDVTTTWTVTGVRSVFPAPLQTFLGHQVGKVWAHSH